MDAVFVIAIRSDTDRHAKIYQRWSALNPELFMVDRHRDPKQGCFESHMKVLETAKRRGLRRVLVLESDAFPLKDAEEVASDAVAQSEFLDEIDPKWKHILLGYFPVKSESTVLPGLVKVKCAFLSHAYVLNVDNAERSYWNNVQVDNVMFCNTTDPSQTRRAAYTSYESGTYGSSIMSVIQDVTLPSTIDQSHVDLQEKILHRIGQDNMTFASKYVNVTEVIPFVIMTVFLAVLSASVPERYADFIGSLSLAIVAIGAMLITT